ncbi:MAG: DNA primase TraC [Chromatiales bacterium USCg_Taylor]|nr:MAG: DNA primase TraC [Chromatiales bacterium USCg_Taylor]
MMTGDIERIREALQFIPASDRDTWVKMGMAVKSELGDAGFDVWEAWSLEADSFNAKDARDVWKSIRGNGKVTAGTLFHEAKANGWRDDGTHQKPTPEELAERRRMAAERAAKEEAEIARERAEAASKAAALDRAAVEARPDLPYLTRKRVSPVATLREIGASEAAGILGYWPESKGKRLAGRLLVVPVYRGDQLSTVELIDEDGRKAALKGRGTKGGAYWTAQPLPGGDGERLGLLIGEGVATVLSGKAASGHPSIAVLSAGNLAAVAKAMRERYPAAEIVILADLVKANGKPDPHAIKAARAIAARLAIPDFASDRPKDAKDFNDLAQLRGLEAVRACIEGARAVGSTAAEGDEPGRVIMVRGADLKVEPINWLWERWLARGKLHILAGAPGAGKSTIAIALAATVTSGGRWPDGTKCDPADVMVWSGEDDPKDTILPRFLAAGGDPRRLHIITGVTDRDGPRPFDPGTDIPALSAAAHQLLECALMIVDPVVAAVLTDSHKNVEVRRALQPLVALGAELDLAVLGISHFTKGTAGRDPIERVTGSIAFGALPRVVMAAAKACDGTERRIFCRAKSNIGPDTGGWEYQLVLTDVPGELGITVVRAQWGDALEGSARELLAAAEGMDDDQSGETTARTEAQEWLRETLKGGHTTDGKRLKQMASDSGIKERTLYRAAHKVGVKMLPGGFGKPRRWHLCAPMSANDGHICHVCQTAECRKDGADNTCTPPRPTTPGGGTDGTHEGKGHTCEGGDGAPTPATPPTKKGGDPNIVEGEVWPPRPSSYRQRKPGSRSGGRARPCATEAPTRRSRSGCRCSRNTRRRSWPFCNPRHRATRQPPGDGC